MHLYDVNISNYMNFYIIIDVVNLIDCFMTTITFTSTLMQVTKRLPTPITDLFVEVEVPTGYKSEFNEVYVIDNIQVTDHIFCWCNKYFCQAEFTSQSSDHQVCRLRVADITGLSQEEPRNLQCASPGKPKAKENIIMGKSYFIIYNFSRNQLHSGSLRPLLYAHEWQQRNNLHHRGPGHGD